MAGVLIQPAGDCVLEAVCPRTHVFCFLLEIRGPCISQVLLESYCVTNISQIAVAFNSRHSFCGCRSTGGSQGVLRGAGQQTLRSSGGHASKSLPWDRGSCHSCPCSLGQSTSVAKADISKAETDPPLMEAEGGRMYFLSNDTTCGHQVSHWQDGLVQGGGSAWRWRWEWWLVICGGHAGAGLWVRRPGLRL